MFYSKIKNKFKNLIYTAFGAAVPLVLLGIFSVQVLAGEFQPPTADFSYSNNNLSVTFTDESTDVDGWVVEWYWDLGDGNHISMTDSFTHDYKYSGTYSVTLEVVDVTGLRNSVTKDVFVDGPAPAAPKPYFSYYWSGTRVRFVDRSTDPDDSIVEWYWDLDDGTHKSMETDFYHTYQYGGTYSVTLEVVDEMGNRDSIIRNIILNGPSQENPVADFSYTADGNQITFSDASTDADNAIGEWYWDLGDGTHKAMETEFSHTYTYGGTYTVALEVVDETGFRNTVQKDVVAEGPQRQNPVPSFFHHSDDSVTYGFYDTTTANNGWVVERYWDLGDGTHVANETEVIHSFARGGSYTVKLEIVDSTGYRDTYEEVIEAAGPQVYDPYVHFSNEVTPESLDASFTDDSISFNGEIVEWYWDLGDGNHVEMQNSVNHTYAQPGIYIVKLEVVDDYGARGTYQEEITVTLPSQGEPEAYYTFYNDGETPTYTFYNGSTSPNGPVVEVYWDFGDGAFESGNDVISHTYTEAGVYTVTLEVVDITGQRDTYEVELYVWSWMF